MADSLTSDQLNQRIRDLCNVPGAVDRVGYEAFGGKPIPYIGWFWRTVNFDSPGCFLGIIPAGTYGNDESIAGFMQNNKWDYPSFFVNGQVWKDIRHLLEMAVLDPTYSNLCAVNNLIQLLGRVAQKSL